MHMHCRCRHNADVAKRPALSNTEYIYIFSYLAVDQWIIIIRFFPERECALAHHSTRPDTMRCWSSLISFFFALFGLHIPHMLCSAFDSFFCWSTSSYSLVFYLFKLCRSSRRSIIAWVPITKNSTNESGKEREKKNVRNTIIRLFKWTRVAHHSSSLSRKRQQQTALKTQPSHSSVEKCMCVRANVGIRVCVERWNNPLLRVNFALRIRKTNWLGLKLQRSTTVWQHKEVVVCAAHCGSMHVLLYIFAVYRRSGEKAIKQREVESRREMGGRNTAEEIKENVAL